MPFVTPDVLGVRRPSVAVNEYLAVRAVEDEFGEVTHLHLWRYAGGSFAEELAVLDAAVLETSFGSRADIAATASMIHEDPASLVGVSLMWGSSGAVHLIDLDALVYYRGESTAANPVPYAPIWGGDGWIYYMIPGEDSPNEDPRMHKIRADMTGDVEVSVLTPEVAPFNFGGLAHVAGGSYHVYSPAALSGASVDQIGVFPLNGDPASEIDADGTAVVIDQPYHYGVATPAGDAIYLLGATGELRLGRFTAPDTEALLWPAEWAGWEDPAGLAGSVLSLSLNPAGTEAVVYAALASGGSTRGILRTDLEAKTGSDPVLIVEVEQHEGAYPDFVFALD